MTRQTFWVLLVLTSTLGTTNDTDALLLELQSTGESGCEKCAMVLSVFFFRNGSPVEFVVDPGSSLQGERRHVLLEMREGKNR